MMVFPFALGTITVPAAPGRANLSASSFAVLPTTLITLIVHGEQAEDLRLFQGLSGGEPVDVIPANTRVEIGPFQGQAFPNFVQGSAGTTFKATVVVIQP
jgi:hypothetical protein